MSSSPRNRSSVEPTPVRPTDIWSAALLRAYPLPPIMRAGGEDHDPVVVLGVVQHFAVEREQASGRMVEALHRGPPRSDLSSLPVAAELGTARRQLAKQRTKVLVFRVETECFAKFGGGHSGELLRSLVPEHLAESRRRESLVDDVVAVRSVVEDGPEQIRRGNVERQHVEPAVVNGDGHGVVQAVEQLLEPRSDFRGRCSRLRRSLVGESEQVIPLGVREPEGPRQCGEDLPRRAGRAPLFETGVVLDRDARDVGEFLASQARHTPMRQRGRPGSIPGCHFRAMVA